MRNHTLSAGIAGVAILVLASAAQEAAAAKSPALKCRGAVVAGVKGVVSGALKALDACHKKRDKSGSPADCNDVDANPAVVRALARARSKAEALCQPGNPLLVNFPNGEVGGIKDVLLPAVVARIERSGADLQGAPTFGGDKGTIKRLAKCHGAIGKARSVTVAEVFNASTACQKRLDKGATEFGAIAAECVAGAGGKSAKALGKVSQLCSGIDGAAVDTCDAPPDCIAASATTDGQVIARLAFGGPVQCGNGIQELGEDCDDGNTADGDACPASCKTASAECGNGITEGAEACDDGFVSGNEDACLNSCQAASCGDGFVHAGVEECDDAAPPSGATCTGCQLAAAVCGADGLVGATVQLEYEGERLGVVRARLDYPAFLQIPGSADSSEVQASLTDLTGIGFIGVNDDDAASAVTAGFLDFDGNTPPDLVTGPLYRAQLTGCPQGTPIRPVEFSCVIEEASSDQGIPVEGVVCSVTTLSASGTPAPTTSSTTATPTTSSSSSSSTSSTTAGATTSTTIVSALCGNGMTDAGESCDDGNTVNTDACPGDCVTDACEPTLTAAGVLTVNLDNTQGASFGIGTVFVDYPEGLVLLPGSADDAQVQAAVTDRPTAGSPNCVVNDRDHGMQFGCLSVPGFPEGVLFRAALRDCANGGPPSVQDFACTVIEAASTQGAEVPATCTVTLS